MARTGLWEQNKIIGPRSEQRAFHAPLLAAPLHNLPRLARRCGWIQFYRLIGAIRNGYSGRRHSNIRPGDGIQVRLELYKCHSRCAPPEQNNLGFLLDVCPCAQERNAILLDEKPSHGDSSPLERDFCTGQPCNYPVLRVNTWRDATSRCTKTVVRFSSHETHTNKNNARTHRVGGFMEQQEFQREEVATNSGRASGDFSFVLVLWVLLGDFLC